MSLIPDFQIGFFNAWLGIVPIILSMTIIFVPNKIALKRASGMSSYTKKEKYILIIFLKHISNSKRKLQYIYCYM